MKENQKELEQLIRKVMDQMDERKYGKKILTHYHSSYQLLISVSHDIGDGELSEKLIKTFLDMPVICSETWVKKELTHRKRCIRLLLSLAQTGTIDWRRQDTGGISGKLMNQAFRQELEHFVRYLEQEGFSPNTMSGYKRIVTYFLLFCEKKGYGELFDIRTNDVSTFILSLYKDGRYRPSTIGSCLAGLRRFLSSNNHTAQFLLEIPVHLPQEVKIMEIYNEKELAALRSTLSSGMLTKRDTAICRLLLETGLRGIDVCSLKLKNIDWERDCISIIYKSDSTRSWFSQAMMFVLSPFMMVWTVPRVTMISHLSVICSMTSMPKIPVKKCALSCERKVTAESIWAARPTDTATIRRTSITGSSMKKQLLLSGGFSI